MILRSREGFLPEEVWKTIARSTLIPCVDVIVEKDAKVLLGFRKIRPYRRVWALPGGRIRKHEHPQDTARRVLKEIGIVADPKEFVGVFPIRFPRHSHRRYDITLC
jgi:colanic acid biosynthesis protein WcaH